MWPLFRRLFAVLAGVSSAELNVVVWNLAGSEANKRNDGNVMCSDRHVRGCAESFPIGDPTAVSKKLAELAETQRPDFILAVEACDSRNGRLRFVAQRPAGFLSTSSGCTGKSMMGQLILYGPKFTLQGEMKCHIGSRGMNMAKFRQESTGKTFLVVSAHIDHVKNDFMAHKAKEAIASCLIAAAKTLHYHTVKDTIIIGGDFNELKSYSRNGMAGHSVSFGHFRRAFNNEAYREAAHNDGHQYENIMVAGAPLSVHVLAKSAASDHFPLGATIAA